MVAIANGRPFRIAELDRSGLTRSDLNRLLATGQVRRLLRGVYVDSATEDSIGLRTDALALVVAENQVIVDRTAAWLWGVDTYAAGELTASPPVEVCVIRGGTRTRLTVARGRSRDLAADDVSNLSVVRVTTPLRTALDLGCHLRRREAYAALSLLAREHDLSPAHLGAGVARFARRRGVRQLRELVPLIDTHIESPREAWTLISLLDAGLPPPTVQYWVEANGVPTYRLDFAYVEERVAVEYDGREFHDSAERVLHDQQRRQWLREHGWVVVVVRLGDFAAPRLDEWTGEVRKALYAARAAAPIAYSSRRW